MSDRLQPVELLADPCRLVSVSHQPLVDRFDDNRSVAILHVISSFPESHGVAAKAHISLLAESDDRYLTIARKFLHSLFEHFLLRNASLRHRDCRLLKRIHSNDRKMTVMKRIPCVQSTIGQTNMPKEVIK